MNKTKIKLNRGVTIKMVPGAFMRAALRRTGSIDNDIGDQEINLYLPTNTEIALGQKNKSGQYASVTYSPLFFPLGIKHSLPFITKELSAKWDHVVISD
jgi:hypothetical protein